MSGHPNRNWRKGWRVDPAGLVAVHESGMRITATRNDDGSLDVEADNGTLPAIGPGMTAEDIQELGRALGRRVEEGGRLLLEAINKPKLP